MKYVYILESLDGARFASYGSASHARVFRSEVSEGCRAVARRAKADR